MIKNKEIERWRIFLETVEIFINNENIIDIFGEPNMQYNFIKCAHLFKRDDSIGLLLSVDIDYIEDTELEGEKIGDIIRMYINIDKNGREWAKKEQIEIMEGKTSWEQITTFYLPLSEPPNSVFEKLKEYNKLFKKSEE